MSKAIVEQNIGVTAPMSFEQERMWLQDRLTLGNPANHIRGAVEIVGPLELSIFEESINQLIKRQEILRTTFSANTQEQVIRASFTIKLPMSDLQELPVAKREATAQKLATELVEQPFDLTQAPPWRVHLFRLDERKHILLLCMHHIICDGDWSLGIFFQESAKLYDALLHHLSKPSLLPDLSLSYQDFTRQQRKKLTDAALATDLLYWQEQLGQEAEANILQLPVARRRPSVQTYDAAWQELTLDAPLTARLARISQEAGVPLFVTLLATFKTLLYRYTQQEQITVGVPTSGRHQAELHGLIGYFGNPLPLRTTMTSPLELGGTDAPAGRGELSFLQLLARVQEVTEQAERHQEYPFQKLVKALNLARDLSIPPLFQVLFFMRNAAPRTWTQGMIESQQIGQLTLTPLDVRSRSVPYDLCLSIKDTAQGLVWTWEYNTDLFDDATIGRMLGHCQELLAGIAANPDQPISHLPLLTDVERQQLLIEWNRTQSEYPPDPIHKLFEAQAARTPHVQALTDPLGKTLTYQELNQRANQLAHYLRQRLDVAPDTLVAICIEPSPEMIVGILGILKAGGAYVPLDAAYPTERLAYMLSDSRARVLVTTSSLLSSVPQLVEAAEGCQIICLDTQWSLIASEPMANPVTGATVEHLAYAIYTSGSTGQPKGAALPHRVLTNLITWHAKNRLVGVGVRMLQVSPISFDVSAQEIFATLCTGGTLVLVSEEVRRNPFRLLALIKQQRVQKIYLPFIALQQLAEAANMEEAPATLKEVITAGEQLQITPTIARFFAQSGAILHNDYGGTEIQDVTALTLRGDPYQWPALPSIGRPIDNLKIYILDQFRQPVPIGVPGDLYVGGHGLARGYLNRPQLTCERFVPNPFADQDVIYKTNDLARYLADTQGAGSGNIEHLGRTDNLVKIRGFRIELGEIETVLAQHPAVRECVVMPYEDSASQKQLVAYVVPLISGTEGGQADLRYYLRSRLPDYMVPARVMVLERMPLTPSGKLNRRALPTPQWSHTKHLSEQAERAETAKQGQSHSSLEKLLIQLWQELLGTSVVDLDETFFDLGGNSLLLIQGHKQLEALLPTMSISPVILFQYPTIRTLAAHLETLSNSGNKQPSTTQTSEALRETSEVFPASLYMDRESDIAIIGIACRFPGADTPEAFWQNLRDGVESISFFNDKEIELEEPATTGHPNYVKAGSVLPDIDLFDANFFGMSIRETEVTDPQQRLLLECAWEAFENAGYNPENYEGEVGVYVGTGISTYLINNVAPHLGFSPNRPFREGQAFQAKLSNDRNYYPTRISYKLNLRGPSVNIQTACSTSLVTVHTASQALRSGECDMALAGGAAIVVPHKVGYLHHDGMIHSPDGHTRAFDAQAEGTLFGNGVGLVLLKRLNDALADGDHIVAVLKGSAINNDGGFKVGYTAPSVEGQKAVIGKALTAAKIDATSISYVEAHGTATKLGDPIEIEALTQAFRRPPSVPPNSRGEADLPRQFCAIGAVKTNIGHLDEAAGIAGLIKTALALKHKQLPPSLHFRQANPAIDFENSPFYVNRELTEWKTAQTPRRAGVSAFGMGGTNCHIILEEAPVGAPAEHDITTLRQAQGTASVVSSGAERLKSLLRYKHLLTLSAKSPQALEELAKRYVDYLASNAAQEAELANICFTANTGRKHFSHRAAFVVGSKEQLCEQLEQFEVSDRQEVSRNRGIAFLFTGQGSQYVDMGRQLYESQPIFRQTIDRCDEILRPYLTQSLLSVLYPEAGQASPINETEYTQPALFALEYALFKLWQSWGIEPDVVMGHSVGEYVAACVAGVFSLEDGLKLIAERGRLMQALPAGGAMLSVMASEEQVVALCLRGDYLPYAWRDEVAIAAINGPRATVLSGRHTALNAINDKLRAAGIKTTKLSVSHAFHSPLMEPMLAEFAQVAGTIEYFAPQRKLISNVTGTLACSDIATPDYWVRHVRQPVRFTDGMESLRQMGVDTFLEIGPKPILLGMGQLCLPFDTGVWLPSLRPKKATAEGYHALRAQENEWQQLLNSLSALYEQGATIDWQGFNEPYERRRLPLPTYPFQRQRYWVEPKVAALTGMPARSRATRLSTPSPSTLFAFGRPNLGRGESSATPVHLNGKINTQRARYDDWFYEVVWQRQVSYGQPPDYLPASAQIQTHLDRQLPELSASPALMAYGTQLEQLESLSISYIIHAFAEIGWRLERGQRFTSAQKVVELGIVERHRALFARFLAILAEVGILRAWKGQWQVIRTPDMEQPQEIINTRSWSHTQAEITLLSRCGPQLPHILRGERDGAQVLFPAGDTSTLAKFYRDSPVLKTTNKLVQQAVRFALEQLPVGRGIRILEIGAGTGGTTSHLLPHLPAEQTEYLFTDVSAFFIAKAKETFQDYPFVTYEVLDIEQDPLSQGIEAEAHHFDLIVAADVLHATQDMRQTMTHVRKLLAPNGMIVLMEDTAPLYWIDLTFGLTEGWWLFTDYDLRPNHPLLSTAKWQPLLQQTGFEDVTITSIGGKEKRSSYHEAVIVARADTVPTVREAGHWLILADKPDNTSSDARGIGSELAERFLAQNESCTVAFMGQRYQQNNDEWWPTFTINPSNPYDFERLLEAIPAVDGIVHCWSLNEDRHDLVNTTINSCRSTLHLVQALLKNEASGKMPRLWLVTQGAQAVRGSDLYQVMSSSLWGMGKIIALEHPDLNCVCVDLDPETPAQNAQRLFDEISSALNCSNDFSRSSTDATTNLAFRDQTRYVPRLAQAQLAESTAQLQIGNGCYLITGGLGGLGLLMAELLVARGARHLALLGRSQPSVKAQAQIAQLEKMAAQITVIRCDVSNRAQVADALTQIEHSCPPLRGVIHAAGVLEDGTIRKQSWSSFEKVMAPKAYGAWHLHELTQPYPLDFFVLFSSSSALLGTAGQANHVAANTFLDALAFYRRREGLPALAINWGAWSKVGATARMGVLDHLRERGEGHITPAEGSAILEQLLLTETTHIGVMPVDWSRFLQKRLVHSPFFANFTEKLKPAGTFSPSNERAEQTMRRAGMPIRQQLHTATGEAQQQLLLSYVETQVIQVLGWNSTQPLDVTLGFFDLGMDSLTSIELRNRLNHGLECRLPVTVAFDYPTIAELVAYLSQELFGLSSENALHQHNQMVYDRSTEEADVPEAQPMQLMSELSEEEAEALLLQELEGFEF